MKKIIQYIFIIAFSSSCTYHKTTDSDLDKIDISKLTPQYMSTNLAIVDLIVDQEEFDYMYENHNEEIEIDGTLEMWRIDKSNKKHKLVADNIPMSIEIKGTTSDSYPLKSIGIKFDDSVDNLTFPVFIPITGVHTPRHKFEKIKSMRLRNSGKDVIKTMIKDVSYTKLAIENKLNFELMYYEPVHAFVNGKYYGFLNLRTEKNQNGISKLLGDHSKNDIIQIKIEDDPDGWGMTFKGKNDARLQAYVDAIKSKNLEYLESETDINSFIDYVVYSDFIGNTDWPHNNIIIYSLLDTKFRFVLYDLDYAGTRDKYFINDNLDKDEFLIALFNVLITNSETEKLLKERQKWIINNGLSVYDFKNVINFNADKIEYDIQYNISKYKIPESTLEFYLNVQTLIDEYKFRVDSYKKHYKL